MNKQRCMTRLKRSVLPVLCLVFLLLGYGPAELYLSNRGSEEFWFSFAEVLLPMAILAIVAFAVIMGLLMVLPTKGYHIAMAVIIAVSVLLLLQGLFLSNNYVSLNGGEIVWGEYMERLIYNTVIWLAVIAGAVIWAIRDWKSFRVVTQFAAAALLVVQAAVLVTTAITGKTKNEKTKVDVYLTTDKLYTVSAERNTIVFILDAFDSQLMCDLIEENPEELETSFEDFTFYHNTSGGATRTKFAIPYILTGKTNDMGGSYSEYLQESFSNSPLIKELGTGKYDTGFYTECGYVDQTQTEAIGNLSTNGNLRASSQWGLFGSLMKMTAFKYAPHVLKDSFGMDSFELAQWRGRSGEAYITNDIQYYQLLKEEGLKAEAKQPVFRFIHLAGAHGPYTMDENMQKISREDGNVKKQGLGALRIVSEYLRQMKSLGIYEKADIFILADRGDGSYTSVNQEQNPLLMVKEAGAKKAFSISEISFTFRDLPSMLTDALQNRLESAEKYETKGTRYFYRGVEINDSYYITEYASEGSAYDTPGWQATGKIYASSDSDRLYELGTRLFFGENGGATAKRHFVKGFTYPQDTFAWTDGKEAELCFETGTVEQNLLLSFDYGKTNGYQRMYFYTGDQLIASYGENKTTVHHEMVIPKEAVKDGILNLRIEFPYAISPVEAGTGMDSRILGITFKNIFIDETDLPFEPEKQRNIPEYMPSRQITFGEDGNMAEYTISGISKDHWTNKKNVTIRFEGIPEGVNPAFKMSYTVYGDPQHVIVSAGGEQIADYTAEGNEEKEWLIPQAAVQNGILALEITLPDAKTPGNGDMRELALWMKKIELQEAAMSPISLNDVPILTEAGFETETAEIKQKVTITAKSSTNATKLIMYAGKKAAQSWQSGYGDRNGVRTWTVTYTFKGRGERKLTFRAENAAGQSEGKQAEITIK